MVTRSPVLSPAKSRSMRGDFVHALVEFLIGDDRCGFVFGFGDEDQRGFVFVFGEMAVDAVVAGVEFSADEPFPEGRIGGVERVVPGLVPIEQLGVDVEAFGEMFFAEFFYEGGIDEIGLGYEFLGRVEVLFFFPMDGDLRFGKFAFALRCLRFCFLASFGHGDNSPWMFDFGCDATTKDSLVRQTHFLCRTSLPAKNDAPTQARESMRASPA